MISMSAPRAVRSVRARGLRAAVALAVAVGLTLFGLTPAQAGPNDPITVNDAALLECINDKLGQGTTDAVTEAQAAGLTSLNCQHAGVSDLTGMEYLTGLEHLDLLDNDIVDVTPLKDLTSLTWLKLVANKVADVTPLKDLTSLTRLTLNGNQIPDVTPLGNLTSLTNLQLNSNKVTDVSPLQTLTSLGSLHLIGNKVADLSPLAGLTATVVATQQSLDVGGLSVNVPAPNPVVDKNGDPVALDDLYDAGTNTLTPAAAGTGSVDWSDTNFSGTLSFTAVGGIVILDNALRACINDELGQGATDPITEPQAATITDLECSGAGVSDLTGMEHFTGLEKLNLNDNNIADVSPLGGLTGLETLYLDYNEITDASPLGSLTSLERLHVNRNNITDVTPLGNLTSLEFLRLSHNGSSDVSPLANLTSLRQLSLSGNGITDVSPLAGLSFLNTLSLGHNGISDVSPLAGLVVLNLDLGDNDISDVSDLSGLSNVVNLSLDNNTISDVSPLASMATLRDLNLVANKIMDLSSLENSSATIWAANQSVDLGEIAVDTEQANPVVGSDGQPVDLDDLYDAATNTFTPTATGPGQLHWPSGFGIRFTGTLSFTVTEAASDDSGSGDSTNGGTGGGEQNDSGATDPGNGDNTNAGADGDEQYASVTLPKTGMNASLLPVGSTALLLLLAGGLMIAYTRRRT